MHRELKLQHVLLQQVAQKVGVTEEATAETRRLVEAAPEGAPIAALISTKLLSEDSTNAELTSDTAEAERSASLPSLVEEHEVPQKSDV